MSKKAVIYAILTFTATVTTGFITNSALATTTTEAEMCGNYECTQIPSIGETCCPWSDEKLKDNIMPLRNQLKELLKLKGVSYTWKDNGAKDIGLIAQDVEKVYPELVIEKNGLKQVDYQKLIGPIVEALREQQKEISTLREELKVFRKEQK
ncbi:tail fiber domain-containing protein [Pantoea agglomerans]|uniref:tail fiber domain-containing protein n=1 Tax=Enterobacter agglomerans TaxID=549 RepID=UPI0013875232|nr:tail fiber domain-containing protein [Pantoea agglomerans]